MGEGADAGKVVSVVVFAYTSNWKLERVRTTRDALMARFDLEQPGVRMLERMASPERCQTFRKP